MKGEKGKITSVEIGVLGILVNWENKVTRVVEGHSGLPSSILLQF